MESSRNSDIIKDNSHRIASINLETPLVQQVLGIAEEIISSNRVLSVDFLYKLAKRRLKKPRKELMEVIQWLLKKKILLEGSKLTREIVLSNQIRRAIYEFVKKHRAVNFCFIKENVGPEAQGVKSPGQLIWHLQILMKYDYLKRVKFKNYSIFIPANLDSNEGILIFLLQDEINAKIMKELLKNDTISSTELHQNVGEGRELIYYRIKSLIRAGMLTGDENVDHEIQINSANRDKIIEILKKKSNC